MQTDDKSLYSLQNKAFLSFLSRVARESGRLIASYFQGGYTVETKADATPVTIADRKAEELLRRLITKEFPDHGIVGEEFGEDRPEAEYVWILDPIDGTKSFIAGVPLFGTLVGLLYRGEPLIGLIANPILKTVLCGDNTRTLLNGTPVRCRDCASLSEAVLSTTSPLGSRRSPWGNGFAALTERVKLFRAWGDCFGYHLLASGKIDLMLDPVMNKWDSLPLIPVIRGAGGVITTWTGKDPVQDPTNIVAAVPGIHREVIATLSGSTT